MVDNIKSKDDITTTSTRSTEVANFYDTVRQNCIRTVDEFAKVQLQYAQSVSILHLITLLEQRILSKVLFQLKCCLQVTETFQ